MTGRGYCTGSSLGNSCCHLVGEFFELISNVQSRLVAVLRVLRETVFYDSSKVVWQFAPQIRHKCWIVSYDRSRYGDITRSSERALPCGHLEEKNSQGENIGAGVDRLATSDPPTQPERYN